MVRKTNWTVPEVKDWYLKHIENERYACEGLLYQGSDEQYHHFTTRILDDWVFIEIKKNELDIDDERSYSKVSSSPLGYYYVDPSNKFVKTREYTDIKGK